MELLNVTYQGYQGSNIRQQVCWKDSREAHGGELALGDSTVDDGNDERLQDRGRETGTTTAWLRRHNLTGEIR